MTVIETIEKLKIFLSRQINSLAINNPLIAFSKPLISRAISNKLNSATGFFSMIADDSGNIDVKTLIPEMLQSLTTTKPFVYHTEMLGDLEIGGGLIKLNIPMTNNQIVLSRTDFDELKQIFNVE